MQRLHDVTADRYRQLESIELMRMLSAKMQAAAGHGDPVALYTNTWSSSLLKDQVIHAFELERKSAVLPATTYSADWASPLVGTALLDGFIARLNQASVLGHLAVTPVPFFTEAAVQLTGASMQWIGQGDPKPVTQLGFGRLPALTRKKASGIVVVTKELAKLMHPGSVEALQATLIDELVAFVDGTFCSAAAATATAPPGVLWNVTVTPLGANVAETVAAVVDAFGASCPQAREPTWVLAPATIGRIWSVDPCEQYTEQLCGFPVVQSPSAGMNLILLDASAVLLSDDGVLLDASDEALVQMVDNPTPPTATTLYISLWQDGLAGFKVDRFVNWQLRTTGCVQFATLP
jgi:hypothetical protein